jgi:antitoxin ParD1/3/4
MDIQLKPELERFIREEVSNGRYETPGEAVNAAVARLQTDTELSADDLADLRAEVDIGIAEADRGEFVEFTAEDIVAERHAAFGTELKDS